MANRCGKLFLIWSKSSGKYSKLCAILAESGWTVSVVQDAASFSQIVNTHSCLVILEPSSNFTDYELDKITSFLARGNSALIAVSANEQDDCHLTTNINELTGHLYGIEFHEDCVIRPTPYELYHPKEAMLEDFVANDRLSDLLARNSGNNLTEDHLESRIRNSRIRSGPRIIYARGCTLKVAQGDRHNKMPTTTTTTIMMTSSRWALPCGQPICTFHQDEHSGRAIVLGSSQLLTDSYLDQEDNRCLVKCLLDFLSPN